MKENIKLYIDDYKRKIKTLNELIKESVFPEEVEKLKMQKSHYQDILTKLELKQYLI